jgi:hypothetical protein
MLPNAPDGLVTSHTPLVQSSWAEPEGDKRNLHDFPGHYRGTSAFAQEVDRARTEGVLLRRSTIF